MKGKAARPSMKGGLKKREPNPSDKSTKPMQKTSVNTSGRSGTAPTPKTLGPRTA